MPFLFSNFIRRQIQRNAYGSVLISLAIVTITITMKMAIGPSGRSSWKKGTITCMLCTTQTIWKFRLHTISITLQTNTGYYDPELNKNDRDENGDRNVPAFLVSYSIGKPFSIV